MTLASLKRAASRLGVYPNLGESRQLSKKSCQLLASTNEIRVGSPPLLFWIAFPEIERFPRSQSVFPAFLLTRNPSSSSSVGGTQPLSSLPRKRLSTGHLPRKNCYIFFIKRKNCSHRYKAQITVYASLQHQDMHTSTFLGNFNFCNPTWRKV